MKHPSTYSHWASCKEPHTNYFCLYPTYLCILLVPIVSNVLGNKNDSERVNATLNVLAVTFLNFFLLGFLSSDVNKPIKGSQLLELSLRELRRSASI